MPQDAAEILKDALSLPREARAALAGSLLESLDEGIDPEAEKAWADEIAARIRDLDEQRAVPVPWTEARLRILGK